MNRGRTCTLKLPLSRLSLELPILHPIYLPLRHTHSRPPPSVFPASLSLSPSLCQRVPCHQTVIPSIPLCLFYVSASLSVSAPSFSPPICLSRSFLLCLSAGERGIAHCCTGKRQRRREGDGCEGEGTTKPTGGRWRWGRGWGGMRK